MNEYFLFYFKIIIEAMYSAIEHSVNMALYKCCILLLLLLSGVAHSHNMRQEPREAPRRINNATITHLTPGHVFRIVD